MRLSAFRSGKHIYAQIIDDAKGSTVVSASTLDKEVRDQIKKSSTVEAASFIGKVVAERAVKSADTLVWRSRLGFNEPYVEYYFRHPAYQNYPVVGVNWCSQMTIVHGELTA